MTGIVEKLPGWPWRASLFLWAVLIFVFSIPHSMALRKLLFLALLLMTFAYIRRTWHEHPRMMLPALIPLLLLQVWMFFVVGVIAEQPWHSLREWISEWLPPLVCFAIGAGMTLGLHTRLMVEELRKLVVMLLVLPISLYVLVNSIVVAYGMVNNPLPFSVQSALSLNVGLADHKADVGYLISLMEPVLIADMISRMTRRQALLPIPAAGVMALLALVLFALVTAGARNAVIVMIFAFALGGVLALKEMIKRYSLARVSVFLLMTSALLAGLAYASWKSDVRWQVFGETVALAWDIDRDRAWLAVEGTPLPQTRSGVPVDESAYYRIAWAHEAWRVLLDHPWGSELGRDAFKRIEVAKYGQAGMAHAHNAWLDTGISIGFPGIMLWGAFLFVLAYSGVRAWRAQQEPIGLALAILIIMFGFRGLLDSIFRDHILEEFMLVAGLLWAFLLASRKGSQ